MEAELNAVAIGLHWQVKVQVQQIEVRIRRPDLTRKLESEETQKSHLLHLSL